MFWRPARGAGAPRCSTCRRETAESRARPVSAIRLCVCSRSHPPRPRWLAAPDAARLSPLTTPCSLSCSILPSPGWTTPVSHGPCRRPLPSPGRQGARQARSPSALGGPSCYPSPVPPVQHAEHLSLCSTVSRAETPLFPSCPAPGLSAMRTSGPSRVRRILRAPDQEASELPGLSGGGRSRNVTPERAAKSPGRPNGMRGPAPGPGTDFIPLGKI